MADDESSLAARVGAAAAAGEPLAISGGGSKSFLGHPVAGTKLDVSPFSGITSYEPSELVITARAGTPLSELEALLNAEGQMLAFEPPRFGPESTIGGVVAAGISGPSRPFRGALRDYVLGCRVIDGAGRQLTFGGQVMKNVAGYDVSRLMAGSMGCLAILTEVSLKVLPGPATEITLERETDEAEAIRSMCELARLPLPVSAGAYEEGRLRIRLSGAAGAVASARKRLGGESGDNAYWDRLRDQQLSVFAAEGPLWRISVPAATPPLELTGIQLIDWAGAQRWLVGCESPTDIRRAADAVGGHATVFRGAQDSTPAFHPLPPTLLAIHRRLKAALDPTGILNPGRMYADL